MSNKRLVAGGISNGISTGQITLDIFIGDLGDGNQARLIQILGSLCCALLNIVLKALV